MHASATSVRTCSARVPKQEHVYERAFECESVVEGKGRSFVLKIRALAGARF